MPEYMFYIGIAVFFMFCGVGIYSIVAMWRCWKRAWVRMGDHDIYGGD